MANMINTSVPAPFQAKPIDYSVYGDQVANAIKGGADQVSTIIGAANTVNKEMNKAELKNGILAELKESNPDVLKYMKPNASFEEVAQSAYQMATIRALWEQADALTDKGADGRPSRTLGSSKNFEQMAFASNEKQFQKLVEGLQTYIKDADKGRKDRGIMKGMQAGAATGGTSEQNIQAFTQQPGFLDADPKTGMNALEKSGKSEAQLSKERLAKLKADAKAKLEAAKAAAKKLAAEATAKHRESLQNYRKNAAGMSELQLITMIQNKVDNQVDDVRLANAAKSNASKAVAKAKKNDSEYKTQMSTYQQQVKLFTDEGNDEAVASAQANFETARSNHLEALNTIAEQQKIVLENDDILEDIERNKQEYKRAVQESRPEIAKKFQWDAADGSVDETAPAPVNPTPAGMGNIKNYQKQPEPTADPYATARRMYDEEAGRTGAFDELPESVKEQVQLKIK